MSKITKGQIGGIVAGSLAISLITFVVIRRNKNKKLIKQINDILEAKIPDPNQTGSQTILSADELKKLPVGNFPLKIGDKNQKVSDVQMALNKKYGSGISVDGKYGESTFVSMCSNIWNKGFGSSYYYSCFDIAQLSSPSRRAITQLDWQNLQKSANFDGEDQINKPGESHKTKTMIKKSITTLKNNPIGAIAGGVLAFYGAKKFGKVENMYALIGISIAGVVLGSMAQNMMKAKASVPTATDVKK